METQPKTREDDAYAELENMILSGELPCAEFLSQRMLAAKVDSSLISVRSALRRLENVGLIENVPRWGVRIPHETEFRIRDRYFLREILELAAVKIIHEKQDATMAAKLQQAGKSCDMISADEPKSVEIFAKLHFEFHHLIAECSGSQSLTGAVDRLNMRSLMVWNATRGWGCGYDHVTHAAYADAILDPDYATAEQAVKNHMHRGLSHELEALSDKS